MADILGMQFKLSYHTSMTYADTEMMPAYERNRLYRMLVDQKNEEVKEIEKARGNNR